MYLINEWLRLVKYGIHTQTHTHTYIYKRKKKKEKKEGVYCRITC